MVNISRYFLASAHNITTQCTNRNHVMEAMKRTIKSSLEYKHALIVKDLYTQLKKDRIGTTAIEGLSKKLCNTLPQHRERNLVKKVVDWKLQDAHIQVRRLQRENTQMWRKERGIIKEAGVLREYERLWRRETTRYSSELRGKHSQKLQHLRGKYKKEKNTVPDVFEGITIKDQEIPENFTSAPRTYGHTTLTNDETELLSLPPKYAVFEDVDEERCMAEVEKGLAKLRWEEKKKKSLENELPQEEERTWHNHESKTLDFRYFRSTNLEFNKRITMPQQLDDDTEINMQNLKHKLIKCTKEYNEQSLNTKTNLTKEQRNGLKSLKRKKGRVLSMKPTSRKDSVVIHRTTTHCQQKHTSRTTRW